MSKAIISEMREAVHEALESLLSSEGFWQVFDRVLEKHVATAESG